MDGLQPDEQIPPHLQSGRKVYVAHARERRRPEPPQPPHQTTIVEPHAIRRMTDHADSARPQAHAIVKRPADAAGFEPWARRVLAFCTLGLFVLLFMPTWIRAV